MREAVTDQGNSVRHVPALRMMPSSRIPAWIAYSLSVLIVFTLTAILELLRPVFPGVLLLVPYLIATMGIAYYFGAGPAVLSILLTMIGQSYVYVQPVHHLWPFGRTTGEWTRLWFLVAGMVAAAGAMVSVRRLTEDLKEELVDRSRNEANLEWERARLRTILDALPVGVLIVDSGGRMVQANPAIHDIWGAGTPLADNVEEYAAFKGWWADTGKPLKAEDWALARAFQHGERSIGEVIDIKRFDGKRGTILSAAVPLRDAQGRLVGGVAVIQDITEMEMLRKDLARALRYAEWEKERLAALEEISDIAVSTRSLGQMLDEMVVRVSRALKADSCAIFIYDEQTSEFVARAAYGAEGLLGERLPTDEGLAEKIAKKRRTILISDAERDKSVQDLAVEECGAKALAAVPLIARGKLVGMIRAYSREAREFTTEEAGMLQLMAGRAALVIENARLMEEVERNFAMLQKALLPPTPPSVPGCKIASAYIPGAAGAEVGGDFYDVFQTEDGNLAVVIGDVAGKGIPSASLAAATRSTVHAFTYDTSAPGESLTHTNAVLFSEDRDCAMFVTLSVAVIDRAAMRIRYASAGHPPPAIYRRESREVEFLQYGDPPVGLIGRYEFREWREPLASGDKIIFYTDGLYEARHDGTMFGFEEIDHVVRAHGKESAQALVDALVHAASDWAHGVLTDDTAVIVLECGDEGECGSGPDHAPEV